MPLPPVGGWIIDLRAARSVFISNSNERISHCVAMCNHGKLKFSHVEIAGFREVPALKSTFIDGTQCQLVPNDDVLARAMAIAESPLGSDRLQGNQAAIFITAAAAANNFGVISGQAPGGFTTIADLCNHFGVPVFTVDEYFTHIVP